MKTGLNEYQEEVRRTSAGLGVEITSVSEAGIEAVLHVAPYMIAAGGFVQGGPLYTVADLAGGAGAVYDDLQVVTVNSDFHYLRSAAHCREVRCHAKEIRRSSRLLVSETELFNEEGELLAKGTFTYAIRRRE